MKIISIINQKGGTGKTTTAINLASCLAYYGKKTLLVDLDPQGHSTSGLGIDNKNPNHSIQKVFEERGVRIDEIIKGTNNENLYIIPSHITLSRTSQEMYTKIYKETYLYAALETIKNNYDYILIDCPPNLGILTVNALFTSDFLIVPCQVSRYSLDGLSDLIDVIREVEEVGLHNNKKEIDYRILLTMFDVRNKVTNNFILKELQPFQNRIFQTKIRKNEALNQAQIAQESIFDYDSKSKGAENYKSLTREILSYE